jgi:hypothetical protein
VIRKSKAALRNLETSLPNPNPDPNPNISCQVESESEKNGSDPHPLEIITNLDSCGLIYTDPNMYLYALD